MPYEACPFFQFLYTLLKTPSEMTSEVIIDVKPKEISIALLEDKRLVEYQNESRSANYSVGNIYVAKVKKLMPGLNACFVDVGYERDAFLHYLDLGSQFNSYAKYLKQVESDRKHLVPFAKATRQPDLQKDGSVQQTLKVGQEVLVQIVKEPISTKGPRLTAELSFAGRFLVLIPFGDKVSVSSKIKSGEEKSRLKQLIQSIKPKNCGVIVRTVAEGKRVAELDAELKILYQQMARCYHQGAEDPASSTTRLRRNRKGRCHAARSFQSHLREHLCQRRGDLQRSKGLCDT
jgi:ribonuclease G